MIRTLIHAIAIAAVIGVCQAQAQQAPRQPSRPPWQDVCCGGPCCKPKPAR